MKFESNMDAIKVAYQAAYARMFLQCKKGATSIEYGVMAALVAIALIASSNYLGKSLDASLSQVAGGLEKNKGTSGEHAYKEVSTTGIK